MDLDMGLPDPRGEVIRLPLTWVCFPLELRPPADFRPEEPRTWPKAHGRLEYVDGRLLYMAPCGDTQQYVAGDVVFVLRGWAERHPTYLVAANEAGMLLGGAVRAADAALWRRTEVGERSGGFQRVPPVLAVEIAGQDEDEAALRHKAHWYLEHGVRVVWIVLPETREVVVLTAASESRHAAGETLPEHPELPGLSPPVERFFAQL